jgi:hypothetical protein
MAVEAPGRIEELAFVVEPLGAAEQRMSFHVGDSCCRSSTIDLRSGDG